MNAAFLLLPFLAVRFGLLAALNGGLCGVWSILPCCRAAAGASGFAPAAA